VLSTKARSISLRFKSTTVEVNEVEINEVEINEVGVNEVGVKKAQKIWFMIRQND
jgi:hypothetical protein